MKNNYLSILTYNFLKTLKSNKKHSLTSSQSIPFIKIRLTQMDAKMQSTIIYLPLDYQVGVFKL